MLGRAVTGESSNRQDRTRKECSDHGDGNRGRSCVLAEGFGRDLEGGGMHSDIVKQRCSRIRFEFRKKPKHNCVVTWRMV